MTAMFNNNNNTGSACASFAQASFSAARESMDNCGTAVLLIMGAVFAASIIIMLRVCGIAAICVSLAMLVSVLLCAVLVIGEQPESLKALTLFP